MAAERVPLLPPRVIYVEDTAEVGRAFGRALGMILKTPIVVVPDAATALAKLAAEHFDVLITDVDLGMSEMDGMDLAERVRKDPPTSTMPIILISGIANTESLEAVAELARANAYFLKPPDVAEVARTIRSLTAARAPRPRQRALTEGRPR